MKNKKNIYILLPVVLLVWGGVLYQVFSFSKTDEILENTSIDLNIKPFKLKERTPFAINVNYRDPFLGKRYVTQEAVPSKKKTTKIKKESKLEEVIIWPSIIYKGIVSDTKDKIKIYMLYINGKMYLMKKGETENEVFLKGGDKESIYVKYKGNLNLIMLAE
jgi:hypothetical protein